MEAVWRLVTFPQVVWRRLLSHFGLVLAVWAGLTLAVAIVVSIPIYAESAGYRILLASLSEEAKPDPLPPFAMVYTYGGARDSGVTLAQYRSADQIAGNLRAAGVALPAPPPVRYAASEKVGVGFADGKGRDILAARIGFLSDLDQNIRLVDGAAPQPYSGSGPIDVLVSETTASKNTLLVGDIYRMQSSGVRPPINTTVRIAGIWRANDAESDYWFNPPATYTDVFLVPEASFTTFTNVAQAPWIKFAAWYTRLDDSNIRSASITDLLGQIKVATANIQQVLPNTMLAHSPSGALERQREQVRLLTLTLTLFSVPLIALIGYFTIQMAGMIIVRQQQEVAVLRSRGSSRGQILLLALGEGIVIAIAAFVAGLPLGVALAQLIAWTISFLRFVPIGGPQPELLPSSWQHGLYVLALALPAILLPAARAAGSTIISFKSERARGGGRPLWQRLYLDVLLCIPAFYGYQQLRVNGMIGVPGVTVTANDPFSNPLLMLAPALLIFSLTLLTLRFLPGLLTLLALGAGRLPGVSLVTALRFLARSPGAYGGPVLLIALTLSLAVFTSSMALTLDNHAAERAAYRGGADVRMVYPGASLTSANATGDRELSADVSGGLPGAGALGSQGEAGSAPSKDYMFVPLEELGAIPGVAAVARVAPSKAAIKVGTNAADDGIFYGVDRDRLAQVVGQAWRDDYADESLGALMNHLGERSDSALVSRRYAELRGLRVGDRFSVTLNDVGSPVEVSFSVAAIVAYFPTLYDEGPPFVIGNLDYSFDQQNAQYPYELWFDLAPGGKARDLAPASISYALRILRSTPQALLDADLLRPERQGLFGLLSVGFLATTTVSVIGFLSFTLLSFQRRLVEIGVLRAIGLSNGQLASELVIEQAIVIGAGAAIGTALGVLASRMFIPFLQVRTGIYPDVPPFLVRIAWNQISIVYAVAGGLLVAVVFTVLLLLQRMRIFEAVKLGEAV